MSMALQQGSRVKSANSMVQQAEANGRSTTLAGVPSLNALVGLCDCVKNGPVTKGWRG